MRFVGFKTHKLFLLLVLAIVVLERAHSQEIGQLLNASSS